MKITLRNISKYQSIISWTYHKMRIDYHINKDLSPNKTYHLQVTMYHKQHHIRLTIISLFINQMTIKHKIKFHKIIYTDKVLIKRVQLDLKIMFFKRRLLMQV